MNYKIVSDSASNLLQGTQWYQSVPLKILGQQEYIDDGSQDVAEMVHHLKHFKGKSSSSCPNVSDWLDAFEGHQCIFAVTITQRLSGSYNAAVQAANTYREEHPDARIYVIDSMAAGPEMAMIVDKIRTLMDQGMDPDQVMEQVKDYQSHTYTLFCLESLTNLARNGRVNPTVAKLAGVLGIRVCGEAQQGQIVPIHKARGAKKALNTLVEMIVERGFQDGCLLRVAHCFAPETAQALGDAILEKFPGARFQMETTGVLCSYYAEQGGLMIGFEGAYNEKNHP